MSLINIKERKSIGYDFTTKSCLEDSYNCMDVQWKLMWSFPITTGKARCVVIIIGPGLSDGLEIQYKLPFFQASFVCELKVYAFLNSKNHAEAQALCVEFLIELFNVKSIQFKSYRHRVTAIFNGYLK